MRGSSNTGRYPEHQNKGSKIPMLLSDQVLQEGGNVQEEAEEPECQLCA